MFGLSDEYWDEDFPDEWLPDSYPAKTVDRDLTSEQMASSLPDDGSWCGR